MAVDRDCITSRRQDILYHAVYWNTAPLNWRNCLKIVLRLTVRTTCICGTLKAHPQSRCYSTLIGWCWRMHPIRVEQIAWLSSAHESWSLWKVHFSKIIWRLALGFSMNLRLNATRRSINLSVCVIFDLEAGRFKFLGENLLGAGELECACHGIVFIISFCFCHPIPGIRKISIGSPVRLNRSKKRNIHLAVWLNRSKKICVRSAVWPCRSKKIYIRSAVRLNRSKKNYICSAIQLNRSKEICIRSAVQPICFERLV